MLDRLALTEVQKGLQGLLSVTSKVLGAPAGEMPEPGEVLEYSLDSARSYELLTEIPSGSDFILASSDGDLSGVQLRVALRKTAGGDSRRTVYLDQTPVIKRVFNFCWLKNSSQPGKTLRLTIGREASAEAITSISLSQISKWGGTTLSARDVSLDLANISKSVPEAKASLFSTALPTANADWLATSVSPTNTPSWLRVYACVSVAGVLSIARTQGGTTVVEALNAGSALVAGAAYEFDVPWRSGDSINFRYSTSGGTINRLLADEVGAAL